MAQNRELGKNLPFLGPPGRFQDPLLLKTHGRGVGVPLRTPHEKSGQRGDPYQQKILLILPPPPKKANWQKQGVGPDLAKSAQNPPKMGTLVKNRGGCKKSDSKNSKKQLFVHQKWGVDLGGRRIIKKQIDKNECTQKDVSLLMRLKPMDFCKK